VETMVNFFKKEASISASETANVLKVVAFVQDMVANEKLPIANATAQVKEYLTLSPVEFKSVAATMNRMNASVKGADKTPESMNPVQSSVGNFGLDDCFD